MVQFSEPHIQATGQKWLHAARPSQNSMNWDFHTCIGQVCCRTVLRGRRQNVTQVVFEFVNCAYKAQLISVVLVLLLAALLTA